MEAVATVCHVGSCGLLIVLMKLCSAHGIAFELFVMSPHAYWLMASPCNHVNMLELEHTAHQLVAAADLPATAWPPSCQA